MRRASEELGYTQKRIRATLAQLVERLIRNQQVASSILAGGSRLEIQLLLLHPTSEHE